MTGIGERDSEIVSLWNEGLTRPVPIRFVATDDRRTSDLEAFLDDLIRIAPNVHVAKEGGSEKEAPAIFAREALCFHAAPAGGELTPFLEALSAQGYEDPETDATVRKRLDDVQWIAGLKIFVTPQCPYCPQVLKLLTPLAHYSTRLHVTVIDGSLFPEMALRDGVRSVPTVILDDQFRWTGSIGLAEILDALVHRDPLRLSAKSLEGFLKEGNAGRLARMMLQQENIFPALLELLTHPDWSVRLGAMVVMEEIAGVNPDLAGKAAESIWEKLQDAEVSVKGDLLYVLGLVGSKKWIPRLEMLLAAEKNTELREVLIETINGLSNPDDPTKFRS